MASFRFDFLRKTLQSWHVMEYAVNVHLEFWGWVKTLSQDVLRYCSVNYKRLLLLYKNFDTENDLKASSLANEEFLMKNSLWYYVLITS